MENLIIFLTLFKLIGVVCLSAIFRANITILLFLFLIDPDLDKTASRPIERICTNKCTYNNSMTLYNQTAITSQIPEIRFNILKWGKQIRIMLISNPMMEWAAYKDAIRGAGVVD